MVSWEDKFTMDIRTKLQHSKIEFDMYKETDNLIYLQQAGNKIFSAVENHLMIKYNKRVRSYQSLLKLVMDNKKDLELLTQAVQLHYFFYNADLQMDRYTAEQIYLIVYNKLNKRLNYRGK